MKNWRTLVLLTLLTLVACDGATVSPPPTPALLPSSPTASPYPFPTSVPPPTLAANPQQAGDYEQQFSDGGLMRTYILHLPPQIKDGKPLPLILLLPGYVSSARIFRGASGMAGRADEQGIILAYLDGSGPDPGWNAGFCCGSAVTNKVDDVGYIRKLIADLEQRYQVDGKRLFVVGHSNGAMLAYRLAREIPEQIAAVVSFSGAMQAGAAMPSQPVAVMEVHGERDPVILYQGGTVFGNRYQAEPDTVAYWVKANHCKPEPQRVDNADSTKESYGGCEGGTAVVSYSLKQGGHEIPATAAILGFADREAGDVDVDTLILNFLKAHPKQ